MTTFALVHGAWLGAWCWEAVAAELHRLGHRTISVDLPCDDPSQTFESYAALITRSIDRSSTSDDVVLVAHSTGGLSAPLVAAQRPLRRLVYLCALVPLPGRSYVEQLNLEPQMINSDYLRGISAVDEHLRSEWIDGEMAHAIMWGDCDPNISQKAYERLRPQAVGPYSRPCPLSHFSETPATYVLCTEDRLVAPSWSRRTALETLGADLLEMPGSHSPFLSRPSHLATVLANLA